MKPASSISVFVPPLVPSPSSPRLPRSSHRTTLLPARSHTRPRHAPTPRAAPSSDARRGAPPPPPPAAPPAAIAPLPPSVTSLLAAGAVIPSLQAALAELVENALDAGAARIHVHLAPAAGALTVTDDGHGLRPATIALAAAPHATSKLRAARDLPSLRTLGFRGNALSALAHVAARAGGRLELSSRCAAASSGEAVAFRHDGSPAARRPTAMAPGTVVAASGLPWRAPPDVRAARHWLARTALAHPAVALRLTQPGRPAWHAPPRPLLNRFARLLRRPTADFRQASRLIPALGNVTVVAGLPDRVRLPSRAWIVVAVNGRVVQVDAVAEAVVRRFELPRARFPAVLVCVELRRELVDWNVSPRKTEFAPRSDDVMDRLVDGVVSAADDLLQGLSSLAKRYLGPLTGDADDIPWETGAVAKSLLAQLPVMSTTACAQGLDSMPARNGATSVHREATEKKWKASDLHVVGQALNTYIVIEHKGGVLLVEQHVADERVIYERLLDEWKQLAFVRLSEPVRLPKCATDDWRRTLAELRFEVEKRECSGEDASFYVCTAPSVLAERPRKLLAPLIVRLCLQGNDIEKSAADIACRIAVKNGTKLVPAQMEEVVQKLFMCRNRHVCPHGRPIAVELDLPMLARLFGRRWSPERFSGEEELSEDGSRGERLYLRSGVVAE